MSTLKLNIPHQLSQQEAQDRIWKLLSNLKEEQKGTIDDVKEDWNGNKGNFSFSAKGFNLAGSINIQPDAVEINADLPFAVSLFKGQISKIITEKASELLKK